MEAIAGAGTKAWHRKATDKIICGGNKEEGIAGYAPSLLTRSQNGILFIRAGTLTFDITYGCRGQYFIS